MEGFEQRGICPICNEQEDMDHGPDGLHGRPAIACVGPSERSPWAKRDRNPIPHRLGDILGCGLANFTYNNRPDTGKNRLYGILVSEMAYLIIWKLRNERRIKHEDSMEHEISNTDVRNRCPYVSQGGGKQDTVSVPHTPTILRGSSNDPVQRQPPVCVYLASDHSKKTRVYAPHQPRGRNARGKHTRSEKPMSTAHAAAFPRNREHRWNTQTVVMPLGCYHRLEPDHRDCNRVSTRQAASKSPDSEL